ncbi:pyridoxamine 5'-phosphate oxidase family protein [Desulfovibrio sp. OttesenSCG-928-M14]|nr:pyridoxamine 5'-phosphate oxidase family protein [Desulfovibrio sp. OttesenSCG-928-M14]
MRRKDRSWPLSDALALLDAAEYGVLALDDGEGWPYAVQLSFVSLDGALYFHSAGEGRKVRALTRNPRVCFTVTGATRPVYTGDFSTYFQSAMVIGEARLVTDDEEAYRALWALAEKYLPEHMDKADKDIKRSFKRTAVYRIAPRIISGKAKRENPA